MKKSKTIKFIEYAIVISFLLCVFGCNYRDVAFHSDESHWIATSQVFETYFSADFSSPLWDLSYWTVTQPPLPRYFIGFGRLLGGIGISDINYPWDYSKSYEDNVKEGRSPSEKLLFWSRLPMKILAAVSIFIGFILIKKASGRIAGYLWVLLSSLSNYFLKMLSRAMGESPLLLFTVISMLIIFKLFIISDIEKPSRIRNLIFYFILLGVVIGFAESSKLNGLSIIFSGFFIAIIISRKLFDSKTLRLRFGLIFTLVLIVSSQIPVFALNPFLWKSPFEHLKRMFGQRFFEMQNQQMLFPNSTITGFSERIQITTNRIFQSYSVLNFNFAIIINIVFTILGLLFLVIRTYKYLKAKVPNPSSISILLVTITTSTPSLFTPLDWDRYFIFPVFFSTMFISLGIGWIVILSYQYFRKIFQDLHHKKNI